MTLAPTKVNRQNLTFIKAILFFKQKLSKKVNSFLQKKHNFYQIVFTFALLLYKYASI